MIGLQDERPENTKQLIFGFGADAICIEAEKMAPVSTSHQNEKLKFHDVCGSLVSLSNLNRTATRNHPHQEFNNGLIMSSEPLKDNQLFEVRIDRKVRLGFSININPITKWNPNTLFLLNYNIKSFT